MGSNELFNIDVRYQNLLNNGFDEACVDPDTGELDEVRALDYLGRLGEDRQLIIESLAQSVKELNAQADAIDEERTVLKKRRDAKNNKAKVFSKYIQQSMDMHGERRFETAKCLLSLRKSTAVDIVDMDKIPEQYKVVTTNVAPNKTELAKALRAGELIDGAVLVTRDNLQIK